MYYFPVMGYVAARFAERENGMPSAAKRQNGRTVGMPNPKHNIDAVREAYYDRIAMKSLAPLWERLRGLILKEPRSRAVPVLWRYDEIRAMMLDRASGRGIATK